MRKALARHFSPSLPVPIYGNMRNRFHYLTLEFQKIYRLISRLISHKPPQDEYFHQLGKLFESIPRQKPNISPLHTLSLAKIKQLLDGDSHAVTKITGFYHPPDAKSESMVRLSEASL